MGVLWLLLGIIIGALAVAGFALSWRPVRETLDYAEMYRFLRASHWSAGGDALVVTTTAQLTLSTQTYSNELLDGELRERMGRPLWAD